MSLLSPVLDLLFEFLDGKASDENITSPEARELCACSQELSIRSSKESNEGLGSLFYFETLPPKKEDKRVDLNEKDEDEPTPACFLPDEPSMLQAFDEDFDKPHRCFLETLRGITVTKLTVRRNGVEESYTGPPHSRALCRLEHGFQTRFYTGSRGKECLLAQRLTGMLTGDDYYEFRKYHETYLQIICWYPSSFLTYTRDFTREDSREDFLRKEHVPGGPITLAEDDHGFSLSEVRTKRNRCTRLFAGPSQKEWLYMKKFAGGRKETFTGGRGEERLEFVHNRFGDEAPFHLGRRISGT